MRVDTAEFEYNYLHINYWYCSEQCKQRFIANPGLYVGKPGEKSPRQQGREIIKKRRISLGKPLSQETRVALVQCMSNIMGIKKAQYDKNDIVIEYDLLEVTAKQIISALLNAGLELESGVLQGIKQSLIDVAEETQLASLEVSHDGAPSKGGH